MNILNVEIKARIDEQQYRSIQEYLDHNHTSFKGLDRQSDYYFNTPQGRLKLRIGNVETSLIYYERKESKDLKSSNIKLYKPVERPLELLETLKAAYGIKVEVIKSRLIYYIDNVKFHLDSINNLGTFCEIEAISIENRYSKSELRRSCSYYMGVLKIKKESLVSGSYSDLILSLS